MYLRKAQMPSIKVETIQAHHTLLKSGTECFSSLNAMDMASAKWIPSTR